MVWMRKGGESQSEFGVFGAFFSLIKEGLVVDARFGSLCCEE